MRISLAHAATTLFCKLIPSKASNVGPQIVVDICRVWQTNGLPWPKTENFWPKAMQKRSYSTLGSSFRSQLYEVCCHVQILDNLASPPVHQPETLVIGEHQRPRGRHPFANL